MKDHDTTNSVNNSDTNKTTTEIEAAVFRRLLAHLDEHKRGSKYRLNEPC